MRRLLTILTVGGMLAGIAPVGAQELPPTPPRDQWYAQNDTGHWSDGTQIRIDEACLDIEDEEERVACSLEAFRAKPFTVIAFVDSGINPYHEEFRAPDFTHHPSTYIEGYSAAAPALNVSLDIADAQGYGAARTADNALWNSVTTNRLYWFPGTRIIGGYSTGNGTTTSPWTEKRILDDQGHGTGVSSVAAGRFFGSNPNALIVMVEALGGASLNWATSQPWIDIVSNSWGNIGNLPLGSATATRTATQRGQTVAFAAGNGATNTNSSTVFSPGGPVEDPCKCKTPDSNPSLTAPYGGPSWVITVGATSPINGQAHWWHSIPVDVSSFGSKWRAASAFGVTKAENRDFGGTSCATPTSMGVLSLLIERARAVFGDTVAGQRPSQVIAAASEGATLPASGPLADGQLTRTEAEQVLLKSAHYVPFDAEKATWDYAIRPTTGTPYDHLIQGYGVVDRATRETGLKVLLGEQPMPDRSDVDLTISVVDSLRNAIWGNP